MRQCCYGLARIILAPLSALDDFVFTLLGGKRIIMVEEKTAATGNLSPEDVISWRNMQCNYSALLYIVTEQQALIGKLLEELLKSQVLDTVQLERITGVYGNGEVLNPAYEELYKRYAGYYLRVREVLEEQDKGPNNLVDDSAIL